MRRFICVFLCAFLLFSSFSLTAFADSTANQNSDLTTDIILFGYDILKKWFDDTNEEVQAMDGDEFYNWYTNNTDFDSALWRGIYGAVRNYVNTWSNGIPNKPKSITNQGEAISYECGSTA